VDAAIASSFVVVDVVAAATSVVASATNAYVDVYVPSSCIVIDVATFAVVDVVATATYVVASTTDASVAV
jgi:hypothetical protein